MITVTNINILKEADKPRSELGSITWYLDNLFSQNMSNLLKVN